MKKTIETIKIDVNNSRTLEFTQYAHNKAQSVFVSAHDGNKCEYEIEIPAGDFVMLWNLYRYVKKNDIRNSFINPNGKNVEEL